MFSRSKSPKQLSRLRWQEELKGVKLSEKLSNAFNPIWCAGDVSRRDDIPCREILHCSHRRLIHEGFQVAPEEVKEIEIRGAWRLSNRSAISNPPLGICNPDVLSPHNQKMRW
ncbi:hypothetical protein TNCV_1095441 [Trichonephila clavipes]|nr:hypothetical protein TNCV_1095441 [Trichonephila clavipes]